MVGTWKSKQLATTNKKHLSKIGKIIGNIEDVI